MTIKTRRQALAVFWGCDVADVDDCRYQSTKTSIPVYTSGENYYCVTKGTEKPATHKNGSEWEWKKIPDPFVEKDGWQVWMA